MTRLDANMKQEVAFVLEEARWPALLLGREGAVLRANRVAQALFGRELSALSSRLTSIGIASAAPPNDSQAHVSTGVHHAATEIELQLATGDSHTFIACLSPVTRGGETYSLLQLFSNDEHGLPPTALGPSPAAGSALPTQPPIPAAEDPRLHFWLESANWPAYLVNADGQILRANAHALQTLGAEVSELTQFLSMLCGPAGAEVAAEGRRSSIGPVLCSFSTKDGSKASLQAYLSPLSEADSQDYLLQLFNVAQPVPESTGPPTEASPGAPQKGLATQNEAPGNAPQASSRTPANASQEPIDPGVAQNQKLECALRLARTVVLDFNNALTIILGHTSRLLGQTSPDHTLRTSLIEVEKAAERAAEIVHDLDDFSRQDREAGKAQSPGNINELVEATLAAFRGSAPPGLEWTSALEKRIYAAKYDEAKLQHAMMKILENSVEAVGPRGKIAIRTRNMDCFSPVPDGTVQIPAGHHVCIEIADNGIGIAPEVLPRIFEPFFTTKQSTKHRGLGLAWVYGIVTNHGGRVAVTSEKGKGTSVRIYLPTQRKIVKEINLKHDDDLRGNQTILIVDDQDLVLTMAEAILTDFGYKVITATNGAKALELLRSAVPPVDLVVTDLVMPGMSGRELIERIREMSSKARLVCTSGYMRNPKPDEDIEYLKKPFTSQELLKKVKQALE